MQQNLIKKTGTVLITMVELQVLCDRQCHVRISLSERRKSYVFNTP